VHGAYGSLKASPSAAAVSARRTTSSSKQVSGQLTERLARLRAEHRAEEDELVHQLQEARVSEEEICRDSEKRLVHPFIPEETIKTPISHTGVAAASSASSTRPQLVEKRQRFGIETSVNVLESRQAEEDWVKRKETETERTAEVAMDTHAVQITESAQPTGAFTLPLETIMMPVSFPRVAVQGVAVAATTVSSASASRSPDGVIEVIEDSDNTISVHSGVSISTFASPPQQVHAADVKATRSGTPSPGTRCSDPQHSAASMEAGALVGNDTAQNSPVYKTYVSNLRSRLFNLTKERDDGLREPVGAAAVTGSDTQSRGVRQSSIALAQMESVLVMEKPANYHEEHNVGEAERELGPWFRQLGFAEEDSKVLVLCFSKPDFGVTNCTLMFSLEDEDVDVILEGFPLGHKRAIKRGLKKGKNS